MKNYIIQFFLVATIILIASCNEFNDFDGPIETNRELAIPLFHSNTTLVDLLDGISEETFITIGPEDLITLNYRGNVAERDADFFFTFLETVLIPLEQPVTSFPFDLPGTLDVTKMIAKAGVMGAQFTNTLDEKVNVTLTIPQLSKNGVHFTSSGVIDSVSSGDNTWITGILNMDGYELEGNNDVLEVIYEATRESDGQNIVFDEIPFLGIQGLKFAYVEGYWGQEVLDLERDTIKIEFFENWVQGDVFFESPKIEIIVNNSFGFPVRSQVNKLEIITVDEDVIELESTYITEGIDFDYPALSEIGVVKVTTFDFDKDNSNVVEVLSSGPVFVDYDVDAVSNPDMIQELGFMTDSNFFNVQVAVELPFRGYVNNFTGQDVFNVNFDSYDNVDYVEFKMIAENELPLGIDVQLYFADENQVIFDSLYTTGENILPAAPVDQYGNVTGNPTEKTTFATIDSAKFNKIKNAKKLIVEGTFFTSGANVSNAEVVNLKSEQAVDIRMGMKIGTK